MRLAENAGCKKIAKNSPYTYHGITLSGSIIATKVCIDNRKNMLNSNISPTSLQYGELRPTSGWDRFVSLGHPANFNGFRVLAALQGTLVVGVSQSAALNRGCHLYLAGRPVRWALAHILVSFRFNLHSFENYSHIWSSQPKSHVPANNLVSDIAIFVLKRDVKLQLTN